MNRDERNIFAGFFLVLIKIDKRATRYDSSTKTTNDKKIKKIVTKSFKKMALAMRPSTGSQPSHKASAGTAG